jgi:hypothetical protein
MKISSLYLVLLGCMSFACSDLIAPKETDQTSQDKFKLFVQKNLSTDFSLQTPIGEVILENAKIWESEQIEYKDEYPLPRMCAHNVSKVLEDSGITEYSSYLVPDMLDAIRVRRGIVQQLPKNDKQGTINLLNRYFNGRLPVGTLINGCLNQDCSGEGGDGHIGILGETDAEGVVWVYHNNWYRPDNEGGKWKPYMISQIYYDTYQLRRQWMKTPWIKVYRDENGLISDLEGLLPALDDMDPFMGYYLSISIMPEILKQLEMLNENTYFCAVGSADLILGFCADGTSAQSNAFGPFTQKMLQRCKDLGYGRACESTFEISGQYGDKNYQVSQPRWSRAVAQSLRGDAACPIGSQVDRKIGYCVEEREVNGKKVREAFGPFPKQLVERCIDRKGGNACYQGRWEANFLKSMLDQ